MFNLVFKHIGDKEECIIGSWSNFESAKFEFETRKHYYMNLEFTVIMVEDYHMEVYNRFTAKVLLTEKLTMNA